MKNTGILSNLIWKFAERICAQVITLIVSIVLARCLLPEDYGLISMVNVFITIADVFVTMGLGQALIQKNGADEIDFSSIFYANILLSILLYSVLFFLAPYIAHFYGQELLSSVIRVMGIRLMVAAVNTVQHAYVSKHMMFRKYFWSTLFGTILSGVVGIIMAYCGMGVWALVAQYMTNSCVDTIVLFFTVDWRPKKMFSFNRVKTLLSYGWKLLFEGVSNTVVTQLRNLIIGKVYTSSDLAYYTKGQQFPSLIINNIAVSISSVLFPAMSKINNDLQQVKSVMRKSIKISSYILFPLLCGFAMIGRPFVSLVLTDKWLDCVPFLQLFCINCIMMVGMYPRHEAIKSIGRSDVYMNEHIIYRIFDVAILLFVLRKGPMAIMVSTLIGAMLLTIILAYTSKKYTDYKFGEQLYDIKNSVLLTIIMMIIIYFISFININQYLMMFIQIVVGMTVYIVLSVLFKVSEMNIILNVVRGFSKKEHR